MSQTAVDDRYFQTERVWKILLRIAPPVMLAQLIQDRKSTRLNSSH